MSSPAPPRILLVSGEQWPRALLRAELLEAGYDAVGAPGLAAAVLHPSREPGRAPVAVIVLDQAVAEGPAAGLLDTLRRKHPGARLVLLARGAGPLPEGPWDLVLRRPISIGAIVEAIRRLSPPPPADAPPRAPGRHRG